jgi:hypothetical protein
MDTIAHNARCLLTKEPVYRKQVLFTTKHHNIYTVEQNKKELSAHDDKRFILENVINPPAWGHYKIKVEKEQFNNNL